MKYYRVAPSKIIRTDSFEFTYHSAKNLKTGTVVKVSHGNSHSFGLVLGPADKPEFKTKPIKEISPQVLPAQLVKTLLWMSDFYATPLGLVINNALPSGLDKQRRQTTAAQATTPRPMAAFKLSAKQVQAVKQIEASHSTVLLHGDTGAGKTLVYRQLIKSTLKSGRSAIVLVPEIGLTPQAASDYTDLSDHLYVTHSGLSNAQRHKIWQDVAAQTAPALVLGPRSALLMPVNNVGLIIIDEAHENSYKQDISPRYQSQTVAAYLASRHKARLVLGTATPRVSDYYLAEQHKSPIIHLPSYHKAKGRQIELIDKADKSAFKRNRYLSDRLIDEVETALNKKEQSMLFLNRRGTATVGLCVSCGWTATCSRCGNQLTLHRDLSELRCHVCGLKTRVPPACPVCGQPDLAYRGAGTKRLEEEVKKLWPTARLARFDTDSLKGQKLLDLYGQLHDGHIDIAIGTQVIARGLDLPKLKVVGVVAADSELYLPDFSASERTFELLYQVIGRAGRLGKGRIVVQAWQTSHPAIKLALSGDYQTFYKQELAIRKEHNYPPHCFLMALVCTYASRQKSRAEAAKAKQRLAREFGLAAIGPTPAFYEKRGNKYRWQVVAKSKQRANLLAAAKTFRSEGWQVDLDPINLLY